MDLKFFFDPTEIDVDQSSDSVQSSIFINHEKMPDHEGLDLALIGLREYRGSEEDGDPQSPDEVRKQLYRLKKGTGDYGIIDLGNLRCGPQLEDTYLRLKEVCSYLMSKEIVPLIFGGSHDNDLGQCFAYEENEKLISLLSIDQKIDVKTEGYSTQTHFNTLFRHAPDFLFNFSQVAYQSFFTCQRELELMDQLSFELIRLGIVKENIKEIEPLIREADMVSFDLSALKNIYVPAAHDASVFGLTGEEACQLCWYAGQNEKLSSIGIYNYDQSIDSQEKKTAFVVSTMMWYFIEGFYHRKGEKHFFNNDYLLYEVHMDGSLESIKFYKSKKSGKWWMEVQDAGNQGLFDRSRMVACSYGDYEKAQSGEIPDRWVSFFNRA